MKSILPLVNIIILNWNGWLDTIECLRSLDKITYPNYHITLIDNGSTDESEEKIKDYIAQEFNEKKEIITFIRSEENHGFAKGCNMGIKYSEEKRYGSLVLPLVQCKSSTTAVRLQVPFC